MGLFKPSAVEKARMGELTDALKHADSLGAISGEDHEARAAQARIKAAEARLNPVHRWVARDRSV